MCVCVCVGDGVCDGVCGHPMKGLEIHSQSFQ